MIWFVFWVELFLILLVVVYGKILLKFLFKLYKKSLNFKFGYKILVGIF